MPDRAVSDDPDVQVQLDRLAQASLPRDVLGFERIRKLLSNLGNPERLLPPVLHVAGTNGKGSTCAFLRASIEAAGLSVHVYTSPHLVRLNERIRVSGSLIPDGALAEILREVVDSVEGTEITFFEATTAAAFLAFARTEADACIVEVGIGGRLDATNVIPAPCVCGITQIGIDHTIYLGDSLEQIAAEKAGIAKAGVPLVTQYYPRQISEVIAATAADAGAPWLPRGGPWGAELKGGKLLYTDTRGTMELPTPRLPGAHQAMNAALAVAMLRHQSVLSIPESAFRAAIGWTEWPARLQRLSPGPLRDLLPEGSELWLDGAHNSSAAQAVADFFRSHVPEERPFHLVFGLLSDRDPLGILRRFNGRSATVHTVPVIAREFHSPADLALVARQLGLQALPAPSVSEALSWISRHADRDRPPIVLVMGSLYLAGEVLRANGQPPA
jgi:dihydrofolate synthase/folylpolyglutamate synthase